MSRQLAKITCHGTYKVIYDETRSEPYRVYHEWYEYIDNRLVNHRLQKFKGKDLSDCMVYITNQVLMWERLDRVKNIQKGD